MADVGKVVTEVLKHQDLIEKLIGLFAGLFKKAPKPLPLPDPKGGDKPIIPRVAGDDKITPIGVAPKAVVSVRLKLQKAQYSRERFPEVYTDENPFGLVDGERLRQIEAGEANLNYGSKIWLDLTAFDAQGRELLGDDIIAADLTFKTEHHCGAAFIQGNGHKPGLPLEPADWVQSDTAEVGNGITSWRNSVGFNHQMKVFREGDFECHGKVGGVDSNRFTIKVS